MVKTATSSVLAALIAAATAASYAQTAAAATTTYSYLQYATTMEWALGAPDKYTYITTPMTGVTDGQKVDADLAGNPPYYRFKEEQPSSASSSAATASWQYQQYIYNQGYSPDVMATCRVGDWQDPAITYDNGPAFLKAYPKEAWTLCSVGASGGLGGGSRWYLFFANVQQDADTADEVCTSKCLIANYAPYGWASGASAPPCWIKESARYYSCFDYDPQTGACPWEGMTDCKKQ